MKRFNRNISIKLTPKRFKMLALIPKKYRSDKICLYAYEKNIDNIKYFPKDNHGLFTEDICIRAIEYDHTLIDYIPEECITTKVGLVAFNKNPIYITYFPKDNPDLFTEDICMKAIELLPAHFIPKKYITPKVFIHALKNDGVNVILYLSDSPDLFKEEVLLEAIEDNPFIIMNVPREYITDNVREAFDKKLEKKY